MSTTQLSQLSIVDRQRRPSPPELAQLSVNGGTLYLLVEVSAPTEKWDAASREIVSRALNSVAHSALSETNALQEAAEAVSRLLVEKNEKLPRRDAIWAGFNAAFVKGNHLYLAQAGPALTYVVRGNALTRFPKSFDDLQTSRLEGLTPLGDQPTVKCRLAHFRLQPDDLIALVASHLPTLASEEQISGALRADSAEAVTEALAAVVRHNDFSALLLHYEPARRSVAAAPPADDGWQEAWGDDEDEWRLPDAEEADAPPAAVPPAPPPPRRAAAAQPVPPAPASRPAAKSAPKASAARAASSPAAAAPPPPRTIDSTAREPESKGAAPRSRTASGRHRPEPAVPQPPARSAQRLDSESLPPPSAASAGPTVAPQRRPDWQGAARRVGAMLVAALTALLAALSRLLRWGQESAAPRLAAMAPTLDRAAHAGWRALYRGGRATRRVLRQVLPGGDGEPAARDEPIPPPPGDGSIFLRSAVILIPLLLLVAVLAVGWARGGGASTDRATTAAAPAASEAQGLVQDAGAILGQAANVDAATAQRLAGEAVALLDQAIARDPSLADTPTVQSLRQQADALLNKAATIAQSPSRVLATLPTGAAPSGVVVGAGTPFVLEATFGALYRIIPTQPQPSLLEPSTTLPLLYAQQNSNGVIIGTPQRIAWIPAGGNRSYDALLILTAEGQLFDFDPQSLLLRSLTFMPVAGNADVRVMAGYGGNLYLLDAANRQVWKYVPDGAGQYSTAPEPWLNPTGQQQFGDPGDMTIDGFIYLLDRSGEVGRFQVGERKAFALDALPVPLTNAVALAKQPPESTDLFVADGQRVVRFDSNGRFLVEYRAPAGSDWGTISDIAVDGSGDLLYVLSSTGLHLVDATGTRRTPQP